MYDKFKDLKSKTPEEASEIVGKVEKDNYLAHSIRQIELAILKTQSMRYHIFTYPSLFNASKIYFSKRHSIIRLQDGYEDLNDKKIRLILSHELGHLVYNIDRLEEHEKLNQEPRLDDEEIYAWKFAYHLVKMKSEEYKSSLELKRFIYDDRDLKNVLSAMLKTEVKPEVYKSLVQSLNLPEFNF